MDETRRFTLGTGGDDSREILAMVYQALQEKGYDPVNQIVGYILTEDPTYITNHKNARNLICKLDRDDLLNDMVKKYLNVGADAGARRAK